MGGATCLGTVVVVEAFVLGAVVFAVGVVDRDGAVVVVEAELVRPLCEALCLLLLQPLVTATIENAHAAARNFRFMPPSQKLVTPG
jgi:hypothetical protein